MSALRKLLDRVSKATGPDPRLDGELDALVLHENEAWPPPYTATPIYLQQITPSFGLTVREISDIALARTGVPELRSPALAYAEALLTALIVQEEGQ